MPVEGPTRFEAEFGGTAEPRVSLADLMRPTAPHVWTADDLAPLFAQTVDELPKSQLLEDAVFRLETNSRFRDFVDQNPHVEEEIVWAAYEADLHTNFNTLPNGTKSKLERVAHALNVPHASQYDRDTLSLA